MKPIDAPSYSGSSTVGIALAVESMKMHMTDEGWQIMEALKHNGYTLCGKQCDVDDTNVRSVLERTNPGVVLVQDKREWDPQRGNFREQAARFTEVGVLRERSDIFKLTIVKDAQHNTPYHRESAEEIGCHAWVIYYNPQTVIRLAPYIRPQHIVRTYHSLDASRVPAYSPDNRQGCLLSGAVSGAYPLRQILFLRASRHMNTLEHPGYHRKGCATYEFMKTLCRYKVALVTSSIYGYVLRKFCEATACGCVVLTDLPEHEVVPEIDGNLIRIPGTCSESSVDTSTKEIVDQVSELCASYDPERQAYFAELAKKHYDYRVVGARLVIDIENMRNSYGDT